MNLEELRLECLKLAVAQHYQGADAVDVARKYSDFVFGTNDGEVIAAARELAGKVYIKGASGEPLYVKHPN